MLDVGVARVLARPLTRAELREVLFSGVDSRSLALQVWGVLCQGALGQRILSSEELGACKLCLSYLVGSPVERIERVVGNAELADVVVRVVARYVDGSLLEEFGRELERELSSGGS